MFSGFLRKEREKRGISQERLCRGVCAVSALSRYENGERIPDRLHGHQSGGFLRSGHVAEPGDHRGGRVACTVRNQLRAVQMGGVPGGTVHAPGETVCGGRIP